MSRRISGIGFVFSIACFGGDGREEKGEGREQPMTNISHDSSRRNAGGKDRACQKAPRQRDGVGLQMSAPTRRNIDLIAAILRYRTSRGSEEAEEGGGGEQKRSDGGGAKMALRKHPPTCPNR